MKPAAAPGDGRRRAGGRAGAEASSSVQREGVRRQRPGNGLGGNDRSSRAPSSRQNSRSSRVSSQQNCFPAGRAHVLLSRGGDARLPPSWPVGTGHHRHSAVSSATALPRHPAPKSRRWSRPATIKQLRNNFQEHGVISILYLVTPAANRA